MGSWQRNGRHKPTTAVAVRAAVGAVTMKDDPHAARWPYVFVLTDDSGLWVNRWSLP